MRNLQSHLFQNVRTVAFVAALSMLLLACGGGDDKPLTGARVLHFTGRDQTEASYRQYVRELKLTKTTEWFMTCGLIKGQTVEAVRKALANSDSGENDKELMAYKGVTPKPGQKGVDADLNRAVEIVMEECKG